jgi:hypothetical protein
MVCEYCKCRIKGRHRVWCNSKEGIRLREENEKKKKEFLSKIGDNSEVEKE